MNKAAIGLSLIGVLAGPAAFAQLQTGTGLESSQSQGVQTPYVQGPMVQAPLMQGPAPPSIAPPPPPAIAPPPQNFAQPGLAPTPGVAPLPQAPLAAPTTK